MKSKMEEGVVKVERIESLGKIERQVEKTEANYRVDGSAQIYQKEKAWW